MIGLKSYLPVLARYLNTTEAVLYERQRRLTQAGRLVGTAGRGPGSGIRITAPNVSLMIMAMMATDDLAEVVARVDALASRRSDQDRCPLTGAATFGSALELVLASEALASRVFSVEVLRSELRGDVVYYRRRRYPPFDGSSFGREREAQKNGLQSKFWLPGDDVLAISKELAAIAVGKSVRPIKEDRDAGE